MSHAPGLKGSPRAPGHAEACASQPAGEVRLLPMPKFCGVNGNSMLEALHRAQDAHPVCAVWDPALRLPPRLLEYACAVCADVEPQIRQEAVLLLKRYRWRLKAGSTDGSAPSPNWQVVALTCANLSMKHWQHQGIPEQKLHWLSCNAYTRQDFIDAEVDVMQLLDCQVHWAGSLLAEWIPLLLHLAGPLTLEAEDVAKIAGVAMHIADVLAFQDELMAAHPPSSLAAATVHAAVMVCTRRFRRYPLTLRVGHFCRCEEEQVVRLSERVLFASIGARGAEVLLEGSGVTAEESDLEQDGAQAPSASPW